MERAQILKSISDQFRFMSPLHWLAGYQAKWITSDCIAGITLAAYAIPVSLAYAALAGLPPQAGVYGYLLGGLGYALLGSSRQLAVGPTSAISLMISATVGAMAEGSAERYIEIAALAAFTVAALCFIAWLLRLERNRTADQRQHPGWIQGRGRPDDHNDPTACPVRPSGRRP